MINQCNRACWRTSRRPAPQERGAGPPHSRLTQRVVDELGRPYRPETLSRNFAKFAARAALRVIRLHDTRHTAASLMLAAGEPPKVVAEILGHSSPTITMNIYQHLMPGMSEQAGARLTGMLTGTAV